MNGIERKELRRINKDLVTSRKEINMGIFIVVALLYSITFVMFNKKISEKSKSGFLVAVGVIGLIAFLLSFLLR